MMYMEDAVNATIQFMQVDSDKIKARTSYNLAAISFTVPELVAEIQKKIPLEVTYKPDSRQAIADSWPDSLDDTEARKDWGWAHKFDLEALVDVMLTNLKVKLGKA